MIHIETASPSEVCFSLGHGTIAMNKPDMLTRVIQTTVVREDEQDLGDALGDALTSTDI